MDRAIGNVMRLPGVSLDDAVRMATTNAARAGGVPGRALGLVPGERADLVQFRFDPQASQIDVVSTWVGGALAWSDPYRTVCFSLRSQKNKSD
jgi:N-acetylglucosamine-6-phosphate deacetylase